MCKKLSFLFVVSIILLSISSLCFAQSDSVIATIWLPDSLGGVGDPSAFAYNSLNNKIYVCGGERVVVIDGVTDQRIAGITVGKGAIALAYNPTNNKIYCANGCSADITIISGEGDSVIATVGVGGHPYALAYNPFNNKIYCANKGSAIVTIIDGASNSVITTVGVGDLPCALAYNPFNNKIYCANSWSGNVTIIDGASNSVITTLGVGNYPHALAYNPTNNKIYCTNYVSDNLTIIDGASNSVMTTVGVGNLPYALAYNPFNNKIYCAKYWSANVTIIDGASNSVITTVGVGNYPQSLTYNSTNNKMYCANSGSDNVTIIDGASNSVIITVGVGDGPFALAHNPFNNKIYCANEVSSNITIIDGASNSVITTVGVGDHPYALAYNSFNNKIYCANYVSDNLTIIDGASNSVITTVGVGHTPRALAYNPLNNKIYCANYWSDNVTVIDGAGNSVVTTVGVGDHPYALAYNSFNNKIYCANYVSDNVTIIDGASNSVITTVGVGSYPLTLAYNPTNNKIYCANFYGSSISVIACSPGYLPLHPGWQWISTNIDPYPCKMESIFVECWDDLDIVKACDGSFCIPGVGCWIDCWNVCEMYAVHMSDACAIQMRGSKVPTDQPCPLPAGWNCIAYFPECSLEPEFALASIWSKVDILKNDDGEFCIPGIGCWIDCMEYNEGYKVHLSSADTLIYPTNCPPCSPPFAKRNTFPGFAKTTHFDYSGNTGESYSIVVDSVELNGKVPEVGDEIGVFTPSGLCVGGGVWQGEILGIATWQDDDQTEIVDGYRVGEQMIFKLWDKSENKEIELSANFEKGDGRFGTVVDPTSGGNAYALVNLKGISSLLPQEFSLSQNHPNPFNPQTVIQYALPYDCEVQITVYNILGQKVKTVINEYQKAGYKRVEWDSKNDQGEEVASGIYFYQLKAKDFTETKKMLLLR